MSIKSTKKKIRKFIDKHFSSIRRIKRHLRKHNIKGDSTYTNTCPLRNALQRKFSSSYLSVDFNEIIIGIRSKEYIFYSPKAATKFQKRMLYDGRYKEFHEAKN